MSNPDTTDLVRVTYPGPHAAVYVPGTPDVATAGEPVEVPRDIGQRLVNDGWSSETLTPEGAPATELTPDSAEEPAVPDGADSQATETATAPPIGETPAVDAGPTETPTPLASETAADPAARTTSIRRR